MRSRLSLATYSMVLTASCAVITCAQSPPPGQVVRDRFGAIVRGDVTTKKLALVFTGGKYGEGTEPILNALKERRIRAAFFVTGEFLQQPELAKLLKRAVMEGHYIGPHSDSHPLYCLWDDRDKTLVTREFFNADLHKNIAELQAMGVVPRGAVSPKLQTSSLGETRPRVPTLFIPPYEWYNADQVRWSREMGFTLINFTPGSGSNRDYAPEGDARFVPARKIYDDILAYEQKDPHGLNGFFLLLHLGSSRKDPFHPRIGSLCDELAKRGYEFARVDELCHQAGR
jgi:peptidoglycan/xylan/chitin deacetylase (PgdA/CDA1 family)